MTREDKKRPFILPELECVTYEGDVLAASGREPDDGGGWGQVFPIG